MIVIDILAVIGMVWVISYSILFKKIRERLTIKVPILGTMLNCWGCTSFWVAIIYYSLPIYFIFKFAFVCVVISVLLQKIYDNIGK